MAKFIIRRILQAIPTFLGITLLSYGIMIAAPGDPVSLLSFGPGTTDAQRAALAERLGVNEPVYLQYITWLVGDDWREFEARDRFGEIIYDENGDPVMEQGDRKGIIRGDFGRSFSTKKPVYDLVVEKIPATLELGALSLLVGLTVGIPIGVLAAIYQGSAFDNITRVMAVLFNAVPVFWLGLLLLLIFGAELDWLPMGGRYPNDYALTGEVTFIERMSHLALPVFVLATGFIAVFSRFMRAATLDILNQDYIRTAHAKGLNPMTVWFEHGARNALIPIATLLGPAIPNVISGALITEIIFSWPGLGRLAFEAVTQLDYPLVMATVIIAGITTILGYMLSDIMYAVIDPRIRLN